MIIGFFDFVDDEGFDPPTLPMKNRDALKQQKQSMILHKAFILTLLFHLLICFSLSKALDCISNCSV